MAIQSNKLPFKLSVKNPLFQSVRIFDNISFYENLTEFNSKTNNAEIQIYENNDLIVDLHALRGEKIKFSMDGLESSDVHNIICDSECYLEAPLDNVKVFDHDNFPLPPGNYIITIEVNGKKYLTDIEVMASRFDCDRWKLMVREIIEKIKWMAFDFAQKKVAISNMPLKNLEIGALVLKMTVIDSSYTKVIAALDGLCNGGHNKISKTYNLQHTLISRQQDNKSQCLNAKKNRYGFSYTPIRYTDYNLAENVYIKRLILNLDGLIKSFIEELLALEDYFNAKLNVDAFGKKHNTRSFQKNADTIKIVKEYYVKALKIRNSINKLKETEWFKNVNSDVLTKIPSQSMFDPRYGILSKLSKDLKDRTINYSVDTTLSVIWKKSDVLYEMWGFLKILEGFETLGYTLDSSVGVLEPNGVIKITSIKKGDVFVLNKDKIQVKMYYDATMPAFETDTDLLNNPLFVSKGNNTPDCRADFYYKHSKGQIFYVGSLVIDFKYRSKKAFWDNLYSGRSSRPQLNNYKNIPKTLYYGGLEAKYSKHSRSPVHEVWAIYPDRYFPISETDESNECIKLYSLVPGYEDKISEYLNQFVEDFITLATEEVEFRIK